MPSKSSATVFSPFANTFIKNSLKEAGFETIAGPSSSTWKPDEELLNASFEFGKAFIESFKTN